MINKDELKMLLNYTWLTPDILKGRDFMQCIEDAIKAGKSYNGAIKRKEC